MAVVILTSAGHAPGVTTTAIGLTLVWPRRVTLVDCDRVPTQGVLGGYLQGVDPGSRGLANLLQAHRERRPLEPVLAADRLPLGPPGEVDRGFIPGFPHPGVVGLFTPAWPELAMALAAEEGDVVVDAGRLGVDGLPTPMTGVADRVLVVTGTSLVSLVALRLYLPGLIDAIGAQRLGLVLVGEHRPYSAGEITAQFGLGVVGSVEWNPKLAAVFSHGADGGRRLSVSRYLKDLERLSTTLSTDLARTRQLIEAGR